VPITSQYMLYTAVLNRNKGAVYLH
jgi:hypothetical protein